MIDFKIDPEFRSLIRPLKTEELQGLEQDIIARGCLDPLKIWKGLLIDGHHRYAICQQHKIEFKTMELNGWTDRDDVKIWILDNQLQRRNLSDFERVEIKEQKREILLRRGREIQKQTLNQGDKSPVLSESDKTEKHNTQQQIAQELNISTGKLAKAQVLIKKADEPTKSKLRAGDLTIDKAYRDLKKQEEQKDIEAKKIHYATALKNSIETKPIIYEQDYRAFLNGIANKSQDLLLTDPPYLTDINIDINEFVESWLMLALNKVKDTGRAYIFTGAYPREQQAYLNKLLAQDRFIIDNPLIWTYRNTLGQTPKDRYNLNYQVIFHLYTKDSITLDSSITNEMFCVQDINAPDGRQGERFYKFQKPPELLRRLIIHATKENDKIIDCFAGSGMVLITANKLKRIAIGCDISPEALKVAADLGCEVKCATGLKI
jgi:DNA modification methylase